MTTTGDLIDYDLADAVEEALRELGDATPSRIARKVRADTAQVQQVLTFLVSNQYAHASGNGAWTHYHPGRAA